MKALVIDTNKVGEGDKRLKKLIKNGVAHA
jgi:hypothetical protein